MEQHMDLLLQAIAALGIGLLIGLEREYGQRRIEGRPLHRAAAGIRTFALVALSGNLLTWLPEQVRVPAIAIGLAFIAAMALLSYLRTTSGGRHSDTGTTSEVVLVMTYILGVLTGLGFMLPATITAIAVFTLLHFKSLLHRFSYSLSPADIRQAIQFLVIAVVILPILPNANYGPFGAFNPQHIWMMVVLISGIGFTAYAAIKILGQRAGLGLTGMLGGLVSSTAVTLAMSRMCRDTPALQYYYLLAILIACTTMFPRILVLTLLFTPALTLQLAPAVLTILIASLAMVALLWRKARSQAIASEQLEFAHTNPLSLPTALTFALFYALVVFFSHFAQAEFGDQGILAVAGLSGLSDVDAITLSLSSIVGKQVTVMLAAQGILLAAAANSLVKLLMGLLIVPTGARLPLLAGLLPMVLLSLAGVVLI